MPLVKSLYLLFSWWCTSREGVLSPRLHIMFLTLATSFPWRCSSGVGDLPCNHIYRPLKKDGISGIRYMLMNHEIIIIKMLFCDHANVYLLWDFLFCIISCVRRLANPVWCGPRAAQKVATSKQQTAQMSIFPFGPENYLAKDCLSLPADVVFLQR